MAKRDILAEIADKKTRSQGRYSRGYSELGHLHSEFESDRDASHARLALYIPGMVACLEVSTREAIKELVDAGQPYLDRAESFKDLKFDFGLTKALSKQAITFGDLVAHLLPVSRLESIIAHFDILLDKSFKEVLRSLREHVDPPEDVVLSGRPWPPMNTGELMVPEVGRVLSSIEEIFRTRHVVVHEAIFLNTSREQVANWFEESTRFLEALRELVSQELYPNLPRGAFAASLEALASSNELAAQVDAQSDYIAELIAGLKDDYAIGEKFSECRSAFDRLRDHDVSFYLALGSPFTGNAMRNLESHAIAMLCPPRIKQLEDVEEWVLEHAKRVSAD